ncbi:MAG: DUF6514 family protein [Firmicutes bacterium]|nr:DUF6514 family protein [Bacillota bacterium]
MFEVTKEKVLIDGEERTVYGIRCGDEYIPNVTADEDAARRLADLCDRESLAPWQLIDVVADFVEGL